VLNFLGDIGHLIMTPLYYAVSAIMVAWHWLFTELGLDPDAGGTWALSIIGLTLVVRAMLIPLFVKQIKSSRNMQLIQPRVKELQKKYGHDRERLAAETMALYKETGTNPFASCLPILVQMPIFLALFRMLDQAAKKGKAHGFLNDDLAESFGNSKLFGTIPLKDTFLNNEGIVGVMVLAAILVVAMTATTFLTQRQLMSKNMPADALTGPLRPAAEAAALRAARRLRRRRHRLPDRRAPLLDHLQPVDDGPAVLRDPQQPGPRDAGVRSQAEARRRQGQRARLGGHRHRHGRRAGPEPPRAAPRQQPKKQTRQQRKKGGPQPGTPKSQGDTA
jgi:YidC/Oxa1 family membrane protein insertase